MGRNAVIAYGLENPEFGDLKANVKSLVGLVGAPSMTIFRLKKR